MKAKHPLLQVARNQSGLFTAQQAVVAGIDRRNHSYYLKSGDWSRIGRGIYQLNIIPTGAMGQFFYLQFWTKNRSGEPLGVFSYETALYLTQIDSSSVLPTKFHITVPVDFRRNTSLPDKLILHYEDLKKSDKIQSQNLYRTTISKTFCDLIVSGAYAPEWIKQQMQKAIDLKLISFKELQKIPVSSSVKSTFNAILFELSD